MSGAYLPTQAGWTIVSQSPDPVDPDFTNTLYSRAFTGKVYLAKLICALAQTIFSVFLALVFCPTTRKLWVDVMNGCEFKNVRTLNSQNQNNHPPFIPPNVGANNNNQNTNNQNPAQASFAQPNILPIPPKPQPNPGTLVPAPVAAKKKELNTTGMPQCIANALEATQVCDDMIFEYQKNIGKTHEATSKLDASKRMVWVDVLKNGKRVPVPSTVQALSYMPVAQIDEVLELLLTRLKAADMTQMLGASSVEINTYGIINVNDSVPAFLANQTEGSRWKNIMTAVLGFRNLLHNGPQLMDDFIAKLFSSRDSDYGSREGTKKMQYLLGNVIHLDQTLSVKNDRQALEKAKEAIESFKFEFDHFKSRFGSRNINISDATTVHKATGNTDKGNYPVWTYTHGRHKTWHANVPNTNDITRAVLTAPVLIAQDFLALIANHNIGGNPKTLKQALDRVPAKAFQTFCDEHFPNGCYDIKAEAIETQNTLVRQKLYKVKTRAEIDKEKFSDKQRNEAYTYSTLANKISSLNPNLLPKLDKHWEIESSTPWIQTDFVEWKKQNKAQIIALLKREKLLSDGSTPSNKVVLLCRAQESGELTYQPLDEAALDVCLKDFATNDWGMGGVVFTPVDPR